MRGPTVLLKGKSHAKFEDVTLLDNQPADLGDFEQHLQLFNSDTLMGMHKSAYIDMVDIQLALASLFNLLPRFI
ncbi:hypothetical protein Hdeb2414_s0002g00065141 [Helianthus debilis subsp. tardiflorus]